MADIKKELLARLAGVQTRRDAEEERHERALQEFDREESVIKAMLKLEESLALNGYEPTAPKAKAPLRPGAASEVESEILEALSNKADWDHSAIKARLIDKGLGADTPHFGRSIQGLLLSMRSRELVENVGTGVWRATKKALEAA
jgi:hypothetical protein